MGRWRRIAKRHWRRALYQRPLAIDRATQGVNHTTKQRIADRIGSAATKGEGRQNMLCAYLAGALLLGLLGNATLGAWWLDAAVGLLIAAVAVKEGREAWRGEGCCVGSPLDGAGPACCRD